MWIRLEFINQTNEPVINRILHLYSSFEIYISTLEYLSHQHNGGKKAIKKQVVFPWKFLCLTQTTDVPDFVQLQTSTQLMIHQAIILTNVQPLKRP